VLSAVNQRQTPASTPVSTPPAGPGSLGGKGLTIVSTSGGAQLSWQGGTLQTGFAVGRWSGSTLTNFAVLVSLPASATSYFDPAASGPVCYAVFPMGMNPQTKSDLVCGIIGYRSASGSPRSFALRLDQSNTATLTWVPPATGSPGGYMLFTLGGGTQTLGSGVTSMTTSANGPTCYLLGATSGGVLIGYTDILCGLPGFSNLS
jgi:hypothetical protein